MDFLVETALLTHGLTSISDGMLLESWGSTQKNIVWVDHGKICIGDMSEYLPFRKRAPQLLRIDCEMLENALAKKLSGALTASGTMAVCAKMDIRMAVTCGMGGIGNIEGEEICPDLPALEQLPVILIATSPKDMLLRKETFSWLKHHGVKIAGCRNMESTGYLFKSETVPLDGILSEFIIKPPMLIINEIPSSRRVQDLSILEEAVLSGLEALSRGEYYHPAVNEKIDRLTLGYSSKLQLDALIQNVQLAVSL